MADHIPVRLSAIDPSMMEAAYDSHGGPDGAGLIVAATRSAGSALGIIASVKSPVPNGSPPLAYEARSAARKRIGAGMSAGRARRRSGALALFRSRPSSPRKAETRGVHTTPGATALTRTPDGPSSTAADFTRAMSPALAAP